MWKKSNGKLICVTDPTRIKFRTTLSKEIISDLNKLAQENNTFVNYLIENGLQNLLSQKVIMFNKELRPKDRAHYKTSYDKELLEEVKKFAKEHDLFINDVIEYSVKLINLDDIKKSDYRNRIE